MADKDIQDLGAILDTVSEKVPNLLREVLSSLYSPQAGSDMGKAVGAFYKELVAAGIPSEEAIKMARDYMISLRDVVQNKS